MNIFKEFFFDRDKDKDRVQELSSWDIPLESESAQKKAYEVWIEDGTELGRLMKALKREYGFYLSPGEEHAAWVDFLAINGANGILIHTEKTELPVSNWLFVAEFMKDRVLSWGYKLYSSSKSADEHSRNITLFRHYLKPPVRNMLKSPIDQIFGNVTIELSEPDTPKQRLKIQIQHYNDRNYREARNIEDLYYSLFDLN